MVFDDNHSLWLQQGLHKPKIKEKVPTPISFVKIYHTPMQDPETVCNTRQTLMSSLNLQEERSSLKVQQENKKRRWLLFLFLPQNLITTSTRLAQALISVGLIWGYHTYVNTHYWQINYSPLLSIPFSSHYIHYFHTLVSKVAFFINKKS